MKLWKTLRKAVAILFWRLRTHGLRTTLIWAYVRAVPLLTGMPVLKYSRITPEVYVGTQYRQAGKRLLRRTGITGDVNMRIEFDDAAHGLDLEHYCYLPVVDDHAPTIDQLEEGIAFIDRVLTGGGKVYIHCAAGVGRAPTMAIAYFLSQGDSLAEAEARVRRGRPFIKIMPPQAERLKEFEDKVRSQ
jgi:hypothetical protein